MRPVTVLSTGGTIAMRGPRARPALDAQALLAEVPELPGVEGLRARPVVDRPGAHLTAADALLVATFLGDDGDVRESGVLPAAAMSPQAARMVVLAGLGAAVGTKRLAARLGG